MLVLLYTFIFMLSTLPLGDIVTLVAVYSDSLQLIAGQTSQYPGFDKFSPSSLLIFYCSSFSGMCADSFNIRSSLSMLSRIFTPSQFT